jgi:hypothetical protein
MLSTDGNRWSEILRSHSPFLELPRDPAKLSDERKIILVSDGIENCNGDPEGIAG